ncbi:MAG: hypothetical protein RDU20_22100 [Desulfomonilaceae bacterium]|nr:hypothetical protein [Desulfomonilaceae bacterium]
MRLKKIVRARIAGSLSLACSFLFLLPVPVMGLSAAEISREIKKEGNRVIIDAFLKYELSEVNRHVTKPMLDKHPSLEFFIKQVERGPLESLFFLEEWVHKLQHAQQNIDSLPYSITFSSEEKKKIIGLRDVTNRIISYGIPLMKRDFYRVMEAARKLANEKGKHPVELIPNVEFRNAIYRSVEPTARALDDEMGKLSEGELICMRLGWVLDQVTITRLWLLVNDNRLPRPQDYMAYRDKRSIYFAKRLEEIYGKGPAGRTSGSSDPGQKDSQR